MSTGPDGIPLYPLKKFIFTLANANFLEVGKSIDGPPLKRLRSNVQTHQTEISHTLTPEMGTHSKGEYEKYIDSSSETLTASETELIHNLVTEKETDSLTNLQKRKAPDDLATSDFSTPRKVRKNMKTMKKILTGQKTKIRTLQHSVRRLRSKVTNLNSLINHLKAKSLVREDCESSLRASMSESTSELFKRMLKGPRTHFDEMSIRKQVEWTGKKFCGYVDIGTDLDSDQLPEAKEVLVFMLVCLNSCWKISVGYFLLDGLSGSDKDGLVKKCLELVNETGVIVSSITVDGAAANFIDLLNIIIKNLYLL